MRTTFLLSLFCLCFLATIFANDQELIQLEKKALSEQNPTLHNKVALLYLDQKAWSKAKKNANKALMLAKASANTAITAQANEILGVVAKERFDYTNATEFLLTGLDGWKKEKNAAGIARTNLHIGQIFYFEKDYVNALIHLNRAKEGFEKLEATEK
ncbi:MAG: hypothetical protein AAGJ18_30705, partial [Bacteroidota bacterium]